MKYIDSEKLIAEIERLDDKYRTIRVRGKIQQAREADLVVYVLHGLSNFIDRNQQEQPEVDLEKEIEMFGTDERPTKDDLISFASHFYELGLNARKEE